MKHWSITIILFLYVLSESIVAQQMDTVLIENVQIISSPLISEDDTHISASSDKSIDEVLRLSSNLFLKSNGPGTSSTTSILGGTASHTTLTIHGIPVTNPLIGQADFSLIPIFFNQSLSLQTGINDKIATSGSIAGNVDISDRGHARPTFQFGSVYRSYSNLESYVAYNFLTSRLDLSVNVSRLDAQNDYKYRIDGIEETIFTQVHAENTSTNAYINSTYHLTDNQSIQLWYWWQDQWRNLPPTFVQTSSLENQEDSFHKGGLIHRYRSESTSLTTKVGYTDQDILYRDDAIAFENTGSFQSQYYESTLRLRQNKAVQLHLGYQGDINHATNGGFGEERQLVSHRLLLGGQRLHEEKHTTFLLRLIKSNFDTQSLKISGFLSQTLHNINGGTFKGTFRKLWRAPGMNDLYWSNGGNPNLRPENGWEANLEYQSPLSRSISLKTTVFSRWLNDYILWAPSEDFGGTFASSNISTVWSRGLLLDLNWKGNFDLVNLTIENTHSLIYSSPDETVESTILIKDAQLIYTPIYTGRLSAVAYKGQTSLRIHSSVTTQYTGINANVDGYALVDLYLGHHFDIGQSSELNVGLEIVNVFDQTYVIIERRPVPGRYLKLNINYICGSTKR